MFGAYRGTFPRERLPACLTLVPASASSVIIRPGPYICAEWDFGGLPWWLLSRPKPFSLRTWDPTFISLVARWFDVLLPQLKGYLYENGGPILMAQLENEYGSFGDVSTNENDKKVSAVVAQRLRFTSPGLLSAGGSVIVSLLLLTPLLSLTFDMLLPFWPVLSM